MQVTSLEVRRQASYEPNAGQLRGIVTLTGPNGQQTVALSTAGLSRIFEVIVKEVSDTARRNAEEVQRGMQDAVKEPLLEASTVLEIEA